MNAFISALWVETLKARRSKVLWLTMVAFSLIPLSGGLFMIILKDPQAARSMGIISTKAQLMAGAADWPAMFDIMAQGAAIGGTIVFAIVTAWVFGREFSDRTAKDLLALPTSREAIVGAKLIVIALWSMGLALLSFGIGLLVGNLVDIPGWSQTLQQTAFVDFVGATVLTIALLPFVALIASAGRGYMLPFGWAIFTVFLAQIAAIMGWGDVFPWSVAALFSGAAGPRAELLGVHSYAIVIFTSIVGLMAVFWWWRNADQTR
jgi:ABC-2 type transport system permease protein